MKQRTSSDTDLIPRDPGTYALIMQVKYPGTIPIGKLGTLRLVAGTWYVYVGSAFGPGGLRGRLSRYRREIYALRWHIDYLLPCVTLHEIWYTNDTEKLEHTWASVFGLIPGASIPLRWFGSSDCRCEGHLFSFSEQPSLNICRKRLGAGLKRIVI